MTENTEINQINQPSKSNFLKSNWKFLTVIGIIVIFGIAFLISQQSGITGRIIGEFNEGIQVTQPQQPLEKEDCPHACCIDGTYKIKQCPEDYHCENNVCKPNDSDGDKLFDYEEKQIGTNPMIADTDKDGLDDYQEVRVLNTQPLNPNSDGDRYNDGEEVQKGLNPLVKNSANINITKLNEKGEYNLINIATIGIAMVGTGLAGCIFSACTVSAPAVVAVLATFQDTIIYTSSTDVILDNQGDDYTSYVNFDITYSIGNKKIETVSKNYDKLEAKQKSSISYSHDIKLKDIINIFGEIWHLITGKSKITIDIGNPQYEKY